MFSRNFIALASLLSSFVFQVDAGSLIPKAIAGDFTITAGDFEIQTFVSPSRILPIVASAQTSAAPWTPTAENLIVNTTVPQGEPALFGWIFPSEEGIEDGTAVLDGFAKIIAVFFTPPGGTEQFVFSLSVGPDTGLCGIITGFGIAAVSDSNDLGTYNARWIVEFGQSTQPYAPVDPNSGCGPEPFDSTTVEFERSWEVVEAE
ncbi:hypothetical protein C8J57DRAFT_225610 [Mycena rebaudengoi]|nr:hypothetical protein C8J57DRAFT_225610 [Mycena rebaudengoi]